jgi:hypothetical protein
VIKMGMGDQDQVNVRQMFNGQPGMAQSPDDQHPIGPIGVDQNIMLVSLNQKGGMSDPGQPNLARVDFRKDGTVTRLPSFPGEEGGEKHLRNETMGRFDPLFGLRGGHGDDWTEKKGHDTEVSCPGVFATRA